MLELHRAVEVSEVVGRTLEGAALSYGRTYKVSDDGGKTHYLEGWVVGAFAETIKHCRNVFELRNAHRDDRLGTVSFEDGSGALAFRATLDETDIGEAALDAYKQGRMTSVSLGFRPRRQDRTASGVIWRNQADIRELSLASQGQYEDARVLAHRESSTLMQVRATLLTAEKLLAYAHTV